jgi:hypothetical protein
MRLCVRRNCIQDLRRTAHQLNFTGPETGQLNILYFEAIKLCHKSAYRKDELLYQNYRNRKSTVQLTQTRCSISANQTTIRKTGMQTQMEPSPRPHAHQPETETYGVVLASNNSRVTTVLETDQNRPVKLEKKWGKSTRRAVLIFSPEKTPRLNPRKT